MSSMIIKNYIKNSVKEQKYSHMQSLFLSFPMLKMYFNYLTVCERSKNFWATCINLLTLEVLYYFTMQIIMI